MRSFWHESVTFRAGMRAANGFNGLGDSSGPFCVHRQCWRGFRGDGATRAGRGETARAGVCTTFGTASGCFASEGEKQPEAVFSLRLFFIFSPYTSKAWSFQVVFPKNNLSSSLCGLFALLLAKSCARFGTASGCFSIWGEKQAEGVLSLSLFLTFCLYKSKNWKSQPVFRKNRLKALVTTFSSPGFGLVLEYRAQLRYAIRAGWRELGGWVLGPGGSAVRGQFHGGRVGTPWGCQGLANRGSRQ